MNEVPDNKPLSWRLRIACGCLLVSVVFTVIYVLLRLWGFAQGHPLRFVAVLLVLAYIGMGVTMAGRWTQRLINWMTILAPASVLIALIAVTGFPSSPAVPFILDLLKALIYGLLLSLIPLATLGWIRFARLGKDCFGHFDPEPASTPPAHSEARDGENQEPTAADAPEDSG